VKGFLVFSRRWFLLGVFFATSFFIQWGVSFWAFLFLY
jgi:hypothetical protein